MIRSLLFLGFTFAFAAGASAQTTPKTTKTTTRTNATTRPPGSASQPAATRSTSTMAETPTSTKGQAQSIYAAPGKPIIVPEGKVGPYDGKAAGRHTTKGGTTLTPR